MPATPVRTRFAPSPTGDIHLGNVRTALFNLLLARHAPGGVFLLRIEDTDAQRCSAEAADALLDDLRWLGLGWDEGPGAGGPCGPYFQSQRSGIYRPLFDRLLAEGRAYPCFCTPDELAAARKAQLAAGRPLRYPGTCAGLSKAEVQARVDQGLAASLRFRVPLGRSLVFDDLVRGEQQFASDDIGDFVIRRSDGTPAFFFSNAVDDALMRVTHVLRGEDHLANTPRQLLLLEALDLEAPLYGHLPLIVDTAGRPLSKREGARSIRQLREAGYLPAALLNHVARLGHQYGAEGLLDLHALANDFELGRLGRAPARHDPDQLDHWQKLAVTALSDEAFWDWLQAGCARAGHESGRLVPAEDRIRFVQTVRGNVTMPAAGCGWAEILYADAPAYARGAEDEIRSAGAGFFRAAREAAGQTEFRSFVGALQAATGRRGRRLFMPLRAALTGFRTASAGDGLWREGPELARVWELLGEQRRGQRLHRAIELCEAGER